MSHRRVSVVLPLAGVCLGWAVFLSGVEGKIRLSHDAEIRADPMTVRAIEDTFNRAEEAIQERDLNALMELYSQDYHYQDLTKRDIKAIWQEFFRKYHHISTSHSFSKVVVQKGKPLTAEILCTGSIWATENQTEQRVNLASWLGDIHFLVFEDGRWRIRGQDRKAPELKTFGGAPPPLF